jgi:hypothetical protein
VPALSTTRPFVPVCLLTNELLSNYRPDLYSCQERFLYKSDHFEESGRAGPVYARDLPLLNRVRQC